MLNLIHYLMVRLFMTICAFYAWIKGWSFEGEIPIELKKCVVIVAPHTSGWDFIIGMAALRHYGYKISYFGKKELFKFPLKRILEKTGGIPVDRFLKHNVVEDTIKLFEQAEQMYLVLSPEGTRVKKRTWRSGFYQIALGANVPVFLGFLDFKRRIAGVGMPYNLTSNKEKDFAVFRTYYRNITPYHPGNWEPKFE